LEDVEALRDDSPVCHITLIPLVLYSYTIHDAMMLSAVKSAAVLTFEILANAKNERCDSLHGTVVDFYMGPHPDAGTITLSTLTSALTCRPHTSV